MMVGPRGFRTADHRGQILVESFAAACGNAVWNLLRSGYADCQIATSRSIDFRAVVTLCATTPDGLLQTDSVLLRPYRFFGGPTSRRHVIFQKELPNQFGK